MNALDRLENLLCNLESLPPGRAIRLKQNISGGWDVSVAQRPPSSDEVERFFQSLPSTIKVARLKTALKVLNRDFCPPLLNRICKKISKGDLFSSSEETSPRSEEGSPRSPLVSPKGIRSKSTRLRASRSEFSEEYSPRSPTGSPRRQPKTDSLRNLWLKITYLTGDIRVDDLDLFSYEYDVRDSSVPLFKPGAVLLRENAYYHANEIVLSHGPVTMKFVAAAAPEYIHNSFYHKDSRQDLYYVAKQLYATQVVDLVFPEYGVAEFCVPGSKTTSFKTFEEEGVISVEQLAGIVNQIDTNDTIMVVSKLGVGSAGVVIVSLFLKRLFTEGLLNRENCFKIIEEAIVQARRRRGPAFVKVYKQLELIVEFSNSLFKL